MSDNSIEGSKKNTNNSEFLVFSSEKVDVTDEKLALKMPRYSAMIIKLK